MVLVKEERNIPTMKRLPIISIILFFQLDLFGQIKAQADSAIIIIKNISKSKFCEYQASIQGEFIFGKNLKPGNSEKYKIAIKESKLYKFMVCLDSKCQQKYTIQPMDYFSQVSEIKISKGTYTYLIDIDKKDGALLVKLVKTE